MKATRLIALVVFLLALCAVPAAMAGKDKGSDLSAQLEAKERAVNDAFKSKDLTAFNKMVDKDAWAIDAMGMHSMSQVADMIKDYDVKSYAIADFKVTELGKDVYLCTYTFTGEATYKGQAMPPVPSYCSSVWTKKGKEWMAVFHQESTGMPATPSTSN